MKKQVLTFLTLLLSLSGIGQKYGATPEDSTECIKRLSLYREFRDQDNYKDAMPHWRKALKVCPKASKRLYIDGESFYEDLIENTEDEELKKNYVDSLMKVLDMRIEHYGQEGYVLGKKGSALLKYQRATSLHEAKDLLGKSVHMQKEESTASALARYYFSLYYIYKNKKKTLKTAQVQFNEKQKEASDEEKKKMKKEIDEAQKAMKEAKAKIINEYLAVSTYLQYNIENPPKPKYKKYYQNYGNKVDKIFAALAKCEEITSTFSNRLENNEDIDSQVKERMLRVMKQRDCKETELYPKLAKELHEEDPSAVSAYNIGSIELDKENYEAASKYFTQAIELAEDSSKLEKYYITAAQNALNRGLTTKANEYARKALEVNPKSGNAYILIASAMASSSSSCGSNDLEKGAVYWVAVDYLQKAKKVDPSVEEAANKKIASFRSRFPSKSTLFDYGKIEEIGSSYQVGCWINETTTIRKAP